MSERQSPNTMESNPESQQMTSAGRVAAGEKTQCVEPLLEKWSKSLNAMIWIKSKLLYRAYIFVVIVLMGCSNRKEVVYKRGQVEVLVISFSNSNDVGSAFLVKPERVEGWDGIANWAEKVSLRERDVIVICESYGAVSGKNPKGYGKLIGLCHRSGAQICYSARDGFGLKIEEAEVLHWWLPPAKPRQTSKAEYYLNGNSTGTGVQGCLAAVDGVITNSAKYLVFVPSRISDGFGYDTYEVPFWQSFEDIEKRLKATGIERVPVVVHEFSAYRGN